MRSQHPDNTQGNGIPLCYDPLAGAVAAITRCNHSFCRECIEEA